MHGCMDAWMHGRIIGVPRGSTSGINVPDGHLRQVNGGRQQMEDARWIFHLLPSTVDLSYMPVRHIYTRRGRSGYIHIHTYIHTYIRTYVHTYIHTYIHTHTYTHAYIHTYIHTCMHACIRTYMETYVHRYAHR